jgi:hypothetical protein
MLANLMLAVLPMFNPQTGAPNLEERWFYTQIENLLQKDHADMSDTCKSLSQLLLKGKVELHCSLNMDITPAQQPPQWRHLDFTCTLHNTLSVFCWLDYLYAVLRAYHDKTRQPDEFEKFVNSWTPSAQALDTHEKCLKLLSKPDEPSQVSDVEQLMRILEKATR